MSMQIKALLWLWMMRLLLQNSEKNDSHTNPDKDNELTIITPRNDSHNSNHSCADDTIRNHIPV